MSEVAVISRLRAFVLERHPFALSLVDQVLDRAQAPAGERDPAAIEQFAASFIGALGEAAAGLSIDRIPETTPGVTAVCVT